ncbi:MAG TPA: hypothetical protein VIO16_13440 [Dehalococcoidia bacterium]
MGLRNLSVLGAGLVLALAACSPGTTASTAPGTSTTASAPASAPAVSQAAGNVAIKIGIELPMTGGEAPNGVPTANGVALAISQLSVPGYTVTIEQKDDALNGKP